MQKYQKNFDDWNQVKKTIQQPGKRQFVREGEVRWAMIGVNVGTEIDGKGVNYARPVLVAAVQGRYTALVIPMSTKIKTVPGYFPFTFQGKQVSLCLHQLRIISQTRLNERMGRITKTHLEKYKEQIKTFYNL